MYVIEKGSLAKDSEKKAFLNDPLKKMFFNIPEEKVDDSDRWELWGTNFDDTGEDYTEMILINLHNVQIWTGRSVGF